MCERAKAYPSFVLVIRFQNKHSSLLFKNQTKIKNLLFLRELQKVLLLFTRLILRLVKSFFTACEPETATKKILKSLKCQNKNLI